MVKFFANPSALSGIVVIPVLCFIAGYTESKNQRALLRTPEDYLHEVLEEEDQSSLASPGKLNLPAEVTGKERSATDFSSGLKFEAKFRNYTNNELKSFEGDPNSWVSEIMPPHQLSHVTNSNGTNNYDAKLRAAAEKEERGKALGSFDLDKLKNVPNDIETIPKRMDFNKTIRNDYSYIDGGSDSFTETNRSGSLTTTTRSLTLINFEGPVISQDVESSEDEGLVTSEHIRVKREFQNSNKLEQRFKDDDKSDAKNELPDIYSDIIDDPLNSNTGVELIRRKRLDYETPFPRSFVESEDEIQSANATPGADNGLLEQTNELDNDNYSFDQKNSDSKYISGPVVMESFSKYEPKINSEGLNLKIGNSDFFNSITNPTNENGQISNSVTNEIGDRFSKHRRKRYTQVQRRTRGRKGGRWRGPSRGRRPRHRRKHKKKHRRKSKKPATKTDEERSAAGVNGDSNFYNKRGVSRLVDEFKVGAHVEKRDSEDARSEIDINKREISGNYNGNNGIQLVRTKRMVENEKNLSPMEKSDYDCRPAKCNEKELRYCNDVSESEVRKQRDYIDTKSESADKEMEMKEAAKSVKQIKKLMEKTIDKLGELGTYVNTGENEKLEIKTRDERAEIVGDFSNSTNSDSGGMDSRNATKNRGESKFCADETNALKSKSGNEGAGKTLKRRETLKNSKIKKRKAHRKWDKWTDWSSCSVTCGKGRQIRWRHCIHECISAETEMEEKTCQLPACGPGKFLGIF